MFFWEGMHKVEASSTLYCLKQKEMSSFTSMGFSAISRITIWADTQGNFLLILKKKKKKRAPMTHSRIIVMNK